MQPRNIILLIMGSVLVWGIFHAVGAYLFNYNLGRPAMVVGFTLAFLAFWGLMLSYRSRHEPPRSRHP